MKACPESRKYLVKISLGPFLANRLCSNQKSHLDIGSSLMGHLAVYFTCLAGNASSWVKLNMAVVHIDPVLSFFCMGYRLKFYLVTFNIYKTDDIVSRVLFI
jgi:hypothetical protein